MFNPVPSECRSQAAVCVSTPGKYPRSGYFLVIPISRYSLSHDSICKPYESLILSRISHMITVSEYLSKQELLDLANKFFESKTAMEQLCVLHYIQAFLGHQVPNT